MLADVIKSVMSSVLFSVLSSTSLSWMWANGEPGFWFDPSDFSTLYQDSAGTTPVTAAGQSVGLIRDKSGRGNHATAAGTKRPTLGRHPASGIRNLYTNTGFAGGATGTPGTAPTGWTIGFATGSIIAITADAALGGNSVTVSATAARQFLHQQFSPAAGTTWTLSADVVLSQTLRMDTCIVFASQPADATQTFFLNGAQVSNLTQIPAGAHKVAVRLVVGATAGTGIQARVGIGCSGLATGSVKVMNPQREAGAVATAYQKVVSAFDVTESPYRDLWYLGFDGVDDALVTSTITPGTDKVQVFAGVRKLSDAATGVLVETSADSGTNAGSFQIRAPSGAASNYLMGPRGATAQALGTYSPYVAPVSNVLALIADLSGSTFGRINGASNTIVGATGGGNFLAYAINIGARAGTSLFFNGRLYGLIGRFGPNLSAGQIANTESWLNAKTGAY